jgi:hypothetical protein
MTERIGKCKAMMAHECDAAIRTFAKFARSSVVFRPCAIAIDAIATDVVTVRDWTRSMTPL